MEIMYETLLTVTSIRNISSGMLSFPVIILEILGKFILYESYLWILFFQFLQHELYIIHIFLFFSGNLQYYMLK